jgi:hypothetical protein
MFRGSRIAVAVAALAATALVPAVASAQSMKLRGVVSGSPYGASDGQMAVPVLFSKITSRDAGLKSPVGVIILKRSQKVKLPDGSRTLPVDLRTGDRFKGVGDIGSLQQRVFYPRVVFSKPQVYFRSKELSLSEISAAIDSLRKALADLQAQLASLQNATMKAFQDVYAQLDAIKKQLAALAALQIPDFQSQIDALNKRIDDLIASLPDFSQFALLSQLPDLSNYVTFPDLTSALAPYATKTYVDNAIAGLQSQINALPTVSSVTTQINNAISGLASTTYVDNAVATVNTRVTQICTSLKNATVDPDGPGGLPAVPVTLPSIGTPCP